MIAQGAHASMKVIFDMMEDNWYRPSGYRGRCPIIGKKINFEEGSSLDQWINGIFKKIIVGGELRDLTDAYQAAKKAELPCSLIEDAGLTEFGGDVTITAVAIGPAEAEEIDKITGHLKLL